MRRGLAASLASAWLLACAGARQAPVADPRGEGAASDIGTARELWDGALFPDKEVRTLANVDRLFPTRVVRAGSTRRPLPISDRPLRTVTFTSGGKTYDLPDYLALNRVVGLLVLHRGAVAFEDYELGVTPRTRWISMSLAKSIVSTLVGVAIEDGLIASIQDPVTRYLPELAGSAYEGVSVRDLLMMASGVKWDETYVDPASDRRKLLELQIAADTPGSIFGLMRSLPRATEPGKTFRYSSGEAVLVGEVVRAATRMPLAEYLSRKIWAPVGMESDAAWWLDSPDGHELGGGGLLVTLRDLGRFGQFILEGARVDGKRIVPEGWLAEATSAKPLAGVPSPYGYGYQWWTIAAGAGSIHEGAFMGRGIHGQYLYVNPRNEVVVVGLGARPKPLGKTVVDDLDFLAAVVAWLAATP